MAAARSLGFGPVIKTILQFEEAFWKDKEITAGKNLDQLSFLFSQAVIPTWWTYYPKNAAMITGWSGGPHAARLQQLSDEEILQKALDSLAEIFDMDSSELRQKLKGWHVANWPNETTVRGGYSYDVVDGEAAKKILTEPEQNTLFFAGEGLAEGAEIGTVEAALKSGRETAHRIIAST
jgi:monoamine oxidase